MFKYEGLGSDSTGVKVWKKYLKDQVRSNPLISYRDSWAFISSQLQVSVEKAFAKYILVSVYNSK